MRWLLHSLVLSLVLTAAFGILGAFSIYFARRDEEGRTFFWVMATLCALAFGFSLGSFNQDARLQAEVATLTARLETSAEMPAEEGGTRLADTLPADLELPPAEAPSVGAEPAPNEPEIPDPQLAAAPNEPATPPEVAGLPEPEPLEAPAPVAAGSPEPGSVEPETTPAAAAPPGAADPVTVGETAAEATPASLGTGISAVTLTELSGTWEMTTTIERTAYPAFAGLELTFRLGVRGTGATLRAVGNKAAERAPGAARALTYAPSAANRIALTGAFVDADTLALSFEEGSEGRGGTMTLQVVSPERLEGVFSSSSADSGGSVVWRKMAGEGD